MLDLIKLRECIDIPTALDALGVEMKFKSQRIWVLCPFHDDKHMGSAYFNGNGRFICHSCGAAGDIFDFTMELRHCSLQESASFLARIFGEKDSFDLKDDKLAAAIKDYRDSKLSISEVRALKFPETVNLRTLYTYDKELYKKIILERAEKMRKEYINALQNLCQRDGNEAPKVYKLFGNQTAASTYNKLANEVKMRIVSCEDIIKRLA